jgi:hypothetical protein
MLLRQVSEGAVRELLGQQGWVAPWGPAWEARAARRASRQNLPSCAPCDDGAVAGLSYLLLHLHQETLFVETS